MSDRDRLGWKLLDACEDGDTAEAKELIAEGAPVDWQDEKGNAPLHNASVGGYTEIMMLLLENKCDANITDKKGNTPLIGAAKYNNMTIARELAWSLCDLKIRNEEGKTAAEVAKEKGNDALAEYLANQAPREQAEIRADPSRREALRKQYEPQAEQERLDKERNKLGQELFRACWDGETAEAKRLIAEGAPVNWQDGDGRAPLHYASARSYLEIVMLLLENKCDTNVADNNGNTPLICAAENNNMTIARELAWSLCDLKKPNSKGKTAADVAKEEGHKVLTEYLANQALHEQAEIRADPSRKEALRERYQPQADQEGLGQELYVACIIGETAEARRLIAEGAPVDWQNKYGNTPLILAASNNKMDTVRALVEAGCDITIRGEKNKTAVEVAKEKGNDALAEYLTNEAPRVQAEIRADPSRREALRKQYAEQKKRAELGQNENGIAPLHYASIYRSTEIVMLLLENKCDTNVTNKVGETPLIWAARRNKVDTVRALVEAGCDITIRDEFNKTAAEQAKQKGYHAIAEYLTNEARLQRFILNPATDGDGKRLSKHAGSATRAVLRDIFSTGKLSIGPCSLIQEFAGKPWSIKETMQYEYGSLGQYVLSNMDGATAPWMRYRLMVVGKDRVGKTSLLKSLRRERFDKDEKSTQVADVNQVRIEDAKTERGGNFAKDTKSEGVEYSRQYGAAIRAARQERTNDEKEPLPKKKAGTPAGPSASPDAKARSKTSANPSRTPKYSKVDAKADRIPRTKETKSMKAKDKQRGRPADSMKLLDPLAVRDAATNESIRLSVWDFAGQDRFYSTHSLFLTPHCYYLVAFSLEGWFSSDEEQNTKVQTLRYLNYWLRAIELHASGALVALVGTKRDTMPANQARDGKSVSYNDARQLREVSNSVKKLLKNSSYNRPYGCRLVRPRKGAAKGLCFFPVDNTISGQRGIPEDAGVVEIRERMFDEIKNHKSGPNSEPAVAQSVPVDWAKVFDAMVKLRSGKSKGDAAGPGAPRQHHYLHLEKVRELCMKASMWSESSDEKEQGRQDKQLRRMLSKFNQLGSLLYFGDVKGLRDHVILNPQWLLNCLKPLVHDHKDHCHTKFRPSEFDDGEEEKFDDLDKGILHPGVLEKLWCSEEAKSLLGFVDQRDRDFVRDLFLNCSLLCRVAEAKYIVPSMLPATLGGDFVQENGSPERFIVQFWRFCDSITPLKARIGFAGCSPMTQKLSFDKLARFLIAIDPL